MASEEHLKIKKAVLTGACGPIGLALLRLLLDKGITVLVFQREQSVRKYLLPIHPKLKVAYYDLEHILDYESDEQDYDAFFHLGWANTWHEYRERLDKQMENVQYTCNAVELAHRLGCKVFVGVGSQAEYGRKNEPLRHDMLCEPETPYGIMKLCACYSSEHLCQKYGIRHVWARVLSAYGLFDNPTSVIISTIRKSIEGEKLEFSSGNQMWDFLHMNDVANALYFLAQKGENGIKYPIGSGNIFSLRHYLEVLGDALGCKNLMNFGIYQNKNGVNYLVADIGKLKEDTGWVPEITFDVGIKSIIPFYQKWNSVGDGKYYVRKTNELINQEDVLWNDATCINDLLKKEIHNNAGNA